MKELLHIFRKQSEIDKIFTRATELLEKELKMFKQVTQTLRYCDRCDDDIDIKAEDKKINRFQMDSRRAIFTHLAISGPQELNSGLILMCILNDVERIGDYFKNILELSSTHPRKLKGGDIDKSVQGLEKSVTLLFESTVEAMRTHDPDTARKAMRIHAPITCKVERLLHRLISNRVGGLNPGEAIALTLYLRFLKRIASHLTNIASSVVNPLDRIGYNE
ncbi:MAG: PhoU domain-containing protein [Acidobacteriota bacterium]|jgi:phosphate uptake regulator|nr:PhoU domain-containing protein [Acidobacteriota bacterium]